jgi:hypothetical protein
MAPNLKIAESYFQRLLLDTAPASSALSEIADNWDWRARQGRLVTVEADVVAIMTYTGEVGNGGHAQFFLNGFPLAPVADAIDRIGLPDVGKIFNAARALIPTGDVERALTSMPKTQLAVLHRLDGAIWDMGEKVDDKVLDYLRRHADEVLRPERGLS